MRRPRGCRLRVASSQELAPGSRDALFAVKGFPRGMHDARAQEALQAIARANAVPDADLPRFPKAVRWDREADFDDRVAKLKAVRDVVAVELDLDPGVLCSRDRMEAVVRRRPRHVDDLLELPELRKWQVEVLGPGFVKALAPFATATDSPYKAD